MLHAILSIDVEFTPIMSRRPKFREAPLEPNTMIKCATDLPSDRMLANWLQWEAIFCILESSLRTILVSDLISLIIEYGNVVALSQLCCQIHRKMKVRKDCIVWWCQWLIEPRLELPFWEYVYLIDKHFQSLFVSLYSARTQRFAVKYASNPSLCRVWIFASKSGLQVAIRKKRPHHVQFYGAEDILTKATASDGSYVLKRMGDSEWCNSFGELINKLTC